MINNGLSMKRDKMAFSSRHANSIDSFDILTLSIPIGQQSW